MEDFCILMCTVMFCLLVLVIVCEAFGIPRLLERGVTALEQIAEALTKWMEMYDSDAVELTLPDNVKVEFITETEDK